jgi:hypothetical protein
MKIEKGVMVMKNGLAWGIKYADGRFTYHGWISPNDAPIHDPKFCKKTTDVTYKDSPYIDELLTAELVHVERRTEVVIVE